MTDGTKTRFASLSATRFNGVTTIIWLQLPKSEPRIEIVNRWADRDSEDIDRHRRIRMAFSGEWTGE
jgi:hypothetical protein